jgi:hypothetical protein
MTTRPVPDAWLHRVKAAVRDLVDMNGGIERSAAIAAQAKSAVARWMSANEPDMIPIMAVLALEERCGVPLVTQAMAECNGRALTDGPRLEGDAARVAMLSSDSLQRAADLMATTAEALVDGQLTVREVNDIDRAASEIEASVRHLRASCAAAKGPVPVRRTNP